MDQDDDILASLPRPPKPAPARREAAIAEALRRFDGGEAGVPAAEARRGAGPAPWRSWFARPQSGALAGALLVALIALPLAWTSLPDRAGDSPARRLERPQSAGPAPAGRASTAAPRPSAARPDARTDAAPGSAAESPVAAPAAERPVAAPAAERPVAAPAPPEPSAPPSEPATGRAEEAATEADRQIVVTGSRIARPNLTSSSPVTSIGSEEFAGSRRPAARAPARRGDWNACTIDDPARSLAGCRASGGIADGLERAWKGDWAGAERAFDSAVAAAPRSSAAWLNRGLLHRRNGDLDRALADLDRAVRFSPRSARYYYQRGLLLRQRGDLRRARADEARAAQLDPRYAPLVSGQ